MNSYTGLSIGGITFLILWFWGSPDLGDAVIHLLTQGAMSVQQ